MPPFDFPNKFSVPFKKRFITLSSSLLMDLLIKVTGYNSKFFFLLVFITIEQPKLIRNIRV